MEKMTPDTLTSKLRADLSAVVQRFTPETDDRMPLADLLNLSKATAETGSESVEQWLKNPPNAEFRGILDADVIED